MSSGTLANTPTGGRPVGRAAITERQRRRTAEKYLTIAADALRASALHLSAIHTATAAVQEGAALRLQREVTALLREV